MKLNNKIREGILDAAMDAIPISFTPEDIHQLLERWADAWETPAMQRIRTTCPSALNTRPICLGISKRNPDAFWRVSGQGYVSLFSVVVQDAVRSIRNGNEPGDLFWSKNHCPPDVRKSFTAYWRHQALRQQAKEELRLALKDCNTVKQVAERYPDLVAFLPSQKPVNPVSADVPFVHLSVYKQLQSMAHDSVGV